MFCLKVQIDGVTMNVTPQSFKYHKFDGAKIISGDKYYIDKAASLGAIKPPVKRKVKKKED